MEKFIVETDNMKEANLMLNAKKLAGVLYDFKTWRRELYKQYDTDIEYLYDGKLYTQREIFELEKENNEPIKDVVQVNKIIDKLDYITQSINQLLEDYYE